MSRAFLTILATTFHERYVNKYVDEHAILNHAAALTLSVLRSNHTGLDKRLETKFLLSSYLFTLVKKPQNRHVIRLKPSVNRALPAAEFNGTLREKLFLILLNF